MTTKAIGLFIVPAGILAAAIASLPIKASLRSDRIELDHFSKRFSPRSQEEFPS